MSGKGSDKNEVMTVQRDVVQWQRKSPFSQYSYGFSQGHSCLRRAQLILESYLESLPNSCPHFRQH
jgi:hypothetical protein